MAPNRKILTLIFFAALLVGFLDALAAVIDYFISSGGRNPVIVFNYIASAVFGRDKAFAGGMLMPLVGLLFHLIIAGLFTIFFFAVYPCCPRIQTWLMATGYGIFIWVVMNLIVVPLSRARHHLVLNWSMVESILILIFVIGWPLSWLAKRYYPDQ
jgi:uncharacterized membrane protein YagU involved in acid resistance